MTILAIRPKEISNTEDQAIPPLQNGDRLTRLEFERRYRAMPDVENAQLIEGVVYMASPVSHQNHGALHFRLITLLGLYQISTPGTEGGDNSTIRLDLDNAPQPDAFLYILPTHGGMARISSDGYIGGAPELVAEVSASSVSIDMNDKLKAYQRNGVREYVVWRVHDRAIDWFILREGSYEPLKIDDGVYKSEIFPGLWLDAAALISGNMPAVARAVQSGLATPEHSAFVTRLVESASKAPG